LLPVRHVTRARLAIGLVIMLALAGAVTWIFASEARGTIPPGQFETIATHDWPVTSARADAIRRDALIRAGTRLPSPGSLIPDPQSSVPDPLTCRYLSGEPSGTSAKFDCVLASGEIVKVKYGRNPEIHAEAAATRLLTLLGYVADEVRIVPRVRCHGCPRYPFLATQLLALVGRPHALAPHGHDSGYSEFEWASVEHRFHAAAVESPASEGWAWFELTASQAPRADIDAFRLLAVFLAHWDNKAENQRLVCLDDHPGVPNRTCARPLLMIQDAGATFGPVKANVAGWRTLPVWVDRRACTVSMRALPYSGATFPDARITEAGRTQLAHALSALSPADIEGLFRDARFPEFQTGTDDQGDLDAWVSAFRYRVDQIATAGPCENG
jgi:hypothetical protein